MGPGGGPEGGLGPSVGGSSGGGPGGGLGPWGLGPSAKVDSVVTVPVVPSGPWLTSMVILFFVVYVAPPSVVSSISSTAYFLRDEAIAPTHRDEAPPRRGTTWATPSRCSLWQTKTS